MPTSTMRSPVPDLIDRSATVYHRVIVLVPDTQYPFTQSLFKPMKNLSDLDPSLTASPEANALEAPQPLTPSRQVELWSGRLAMVGFTTTVMAIAARAGL